MSVFDPSVGVPSRDAMPVRRLSTVVIPFLVLAGVVGLIGWSAWPTMRPARQVEVSQAVFVRSADASSSGSGGGLGASSDGGEALGGRSVQAPGWLEAEPFVVSCSALTDGVLEDVVVLEGDSVERGQVVARLISDDARLALADAEAELGIARAMGRSASADLAAAQAVWDEPVERRRAVAVAQARVEEVEAELGQLPMLVATQRASMVQAQEELARTRDSHENRVATDYELIVAEQAYAMRRSMVESTEARGGILQAQLKRLKAELHAAQRDAELLVVERQRLESAWAAAARADAAVEKAEAARDVAALALARTEIRAPMSGVVQARLKSPGDKVVRMGDSPESAQVLRLYDPGQLQVRVDVPLAEAAGVRVGQACEVIVEVLPDEVFRGEVLLITHEADLQKNTLQVKVRVLDPSPMLRPEMLTRVKFLADGSSVAGERRSLLGEEAGEVSVRVPRASLRAGGREVWVVRGRHGGGGVVTPIGVEVVEDEGEWCVVRGGVRGGDLLVVSDGEFVAGEVVRFSAAAREEES